MNETIDQPQPEVHASAVNSQKTQEDTSTRHPFVAYTRFADVEEKLEGLFVHKAPFPIADSTLNWVVSLAPWAGLGAFLIYIPSMFTLLGISTLIAPLALFSAGGIESGLQHVVGLVFLIGAVLFLGRSIPGLFGHTRAGWTFSVYGWALQVAHAVFMLRFVSAGTCLFMLFLLFQTKYKYGAADIDPKATPT